jgi:hypothetical protein
VQERTIGVDRRRAVAGEELQREQRGAARRRTFVLEAPTKQLQLLSEPELPDRTVGDGAFPEVRASGCSLELVVPSGAERGELGLRAGLG